jgi:hypothetical protein
MERRERSKSARTSQKLREQHDAREPHERARTTACRRRTLMPSTPYQHSASSTLCIEHTLHDHALHDHALPEKAMAETSSGKEETPLLDIW